MSNNNESNKKDFIKKIKEMWKDKKGRAIIKLSLWFIFFFIAIIFVKINGSLMKKNKNVNDIGDTFVTSISDNYEYNIYINLNGNVYNYKGTILGNNGNIIKKDNGEYKYKILNKDYYLLDENGNYILTTKEDVFSNIDYKYIDINYIRKLISIGIKKDDNYIIELNKLILNSTSEEYITINVNEENKTISIDYTNLLKIIDNSISNFNVDIQYSNINKILSLD